MQKYFGWRRNRLSNALERIIASKRLPALFIGSGLSKRYLRYYPTWEELLDSLREQIGVSKTAFAAKQHEFKSQDNNITKGKLNQKMASYLQFKLLTKIENDEIDLKTLFTEEEINRCIHEGVDYFKMLVAKSTLNYEVNDEKIDEIDKLKTISEKVSMVFTTNYDLFLQKEIFNDFKVYESQNKYYFRTSNGYGELYKIHGCATDPNGIIFCEKDYERFDSSLKLISSKLINALLDFPIIFIGYSLEDENIKKIMTDFVNSFDNDILQEIKKYIILVIYEKGQTNLIEGEKQFADEGSGKAITLTTIKTDNFMTIYNYIDRLKPCATAYELRKYKIMLAEIISHEAKGVKKVYAQEIDSAKADEIAIYIGSKPTVESLEKSVNIYKNEDIIKKALLNEPFDYNSFAQFWYDNKCIKSTQYTPVFYLKNKITIPYDKCGDKFKANCDSRKKYFAKNLKLDNNITTISLDKKNLEERIDALKGINKQLSSKYMSFCNDCIGSLYNDKITVKECNDLLIKLMNDYPDSIFCSSFKKAACYMWYKQFEN